MPQKHKPSIANRGTRHHGEAQSYHANRGTRHHGEAPSQQEIVRQVQDYDVKDPKNDYERVTGKSAGRLTKVKHALGVVAGGAIVVAAFGTLMAKNEASSASIEKIEITSSPVFAGALDLKAGVNIRSTPEMIDAVPSDGDFDTNVVYTVKPKEEIIVKNPISEGSFFGFTNDTGALVWVNKKVLSQESANGTAFATAFGIPEQFGQNMSASYDGRQLNAFDGSHNPVRVGEAFAVTPDMASATLQSIGVTNGS